MKAETALPPLGCPCYFVTRMPAGMECLRSLFEGVMPLPRPSIGGNGTGGRLDFNTYIQLRRRGIDARLVIGFNREGSASPATTPSPGSAAGSRVTLSVPRWIGPCPRPPSAMKRSSRIARCAALPRITLCLTGLSFPASPDDVRRANVRRIAFHGEIENLAAPFRNEQS